mgnify:CR=1 FL=1
MACHVLTGDMVLDIAKKLRPADYDALRQASAGIKTRLDPLAYSNIESLPLLLLHKFKCVGGWRAVYKTARKIRTNGSKQAQRFNAEPCLALCAYRLMGETPREIRRWHKSKEWQDILHGFFLITLCTSVDLRPFALALLVKASLDDLESAFKLCWASAV